MVRCIMATARTISLLLWMWSETTGMVFLCCLTCVAFDGLDHGTGICIWTMCVMLASKLCRFCYYIELGVVITLFILRCMLNYLWTCCNMWHVCWIMYDLGCMLVMFWDPSWYSTNYQVYMGSSVCGSTCKPGPSCLILYKLVGSVTLHLQTNSQIWKQRYLVLGSL
jgi:hypothetical protein